MPDRPTLDPHRTALLVMDFQAGLVGRLPEPDTLLDRVSVAVDSFRSHDALVGWVRIGFEDAEFDAVPDTSVFAAMIPPERRPTMHADGPGTQLHPRLAVRPGDMIVRKTRVGSFSTTDLDRQLRDRGVSTLVLAGIATSGVVLTTVREAMDRDYRIVVLRDAGADPDPAIHDFLTGTLFPAHTYVTTAGDLDALWTSSATTSA